MHLRALLILLLVVAGCGEQPITSSGKPVEFWLEQMQSPDARERQKAVRALGHLGPKVTGVMSALIEAVEDRDAKVRAEAVLALLNIGPPAREASQALQKATRDRDERVRRLAAKALERIRGAAP